MYQQVAMLAMMPQTGDPTSPWFWIFVFIAGFAFVGAGLAVRRILPAHLFGRFKKS